MKTLVSLSIVVFSGLILGGTMTAGCGSDAEATSDEGGTQTFTDDGGSPDPFFPDGAVAGGGGILVDGGLVGCTPGTTQCTNCIDDDGDGLPDFLDPECTGNLDNDESSFATGIAGDNVDVCKQDCFFDGNSGQGDDKCEWNLKCDPLSPGAPSCPYDANYKNCPATQSQTCIDTCRKVTPNGCDCFGCCAVPTAGGIKTVVLSGTCNIASVDDPTKCKPCTQNAGCTNPCDTCELCVGKTTLPPECAPAGSDGGTAGQVCSDGSPVCNGSVACPTGTFCLTGCCVPNLR